MRALKVYLAAPFVMKDIITTRAAELQDLGILVTSSWINEPQKPTTQLHELPPEVRRGYAIRDVNDIWAADVFVFHNDLTKTVIRAGRHVEFGIAIGIARTRPIPIFVVGSEYENIFHHLPQVYHFDSWEKTKERLGELARIQ